MLRPKQKYLALLLFPLLLISSFPAVAQRRPAAPRKTVPATPAAEPVVSFDTLLADDQYRIYSEIRNVGTLVRSPGFSELLEPLAQFAEPGEQFSTVLNWIKAHSELLAGSKFSVATWPSKSTLPDFVFAIELASAADAKKLEAELRRWLPRLDPKPKPNASASTEPSAEPTPNPGRFGQMQLHQVGALVLLSEKRIALQDLKPPRRRLLAENPNFVMTRNRFASEPIFLYVDFKAIEKDDLKRRQKWQEEQRIAEERAAANPTPEPSPEPAFEEEISIDSGIEFQPPPADAPPDAPNEVRPPAVANSEAQLANSFAFALHPLSMALFGGSAKYPEALGAALAFEGDSYAVRALLINSPENRSFPVPFLPQLASGPPVTPASPGILPGDVDLFVALSLDYQQIHDAMNKIFADQPWITVQTANPNRRPATPFSTFEEKVGIKVKEDLLPLLGNEIAFVLTKPPVATVPPREAAPPDNEDVRSVRMPELLPVIAVSIKDREAVKQVIPKMFENMGLKGAAALAHAEKRGDAEIVSYANLFAYAFIGDFLVFAPDPAQTRRAVDSYLSSETLSSNSKFRNATRWQGRQAQGMGYLSADLVEQYVFAGKGKLETLSPTNQPIEPLTYMLSNEGLGPVHELHISRTFVQMVVTGFTAKSDEPPIFYNESIAKDVLRMVASAQSTYRKTKGAGVYGSLDELVAEGLIPKDLTQKYGYKIAMSVLSTRFEATATPLEYGKTGKRSFYIDETGILRGSDHGGGPATLSDPPIKD